MGIRMEIRELVGNAKDIMAMRDQFYSNIPLGILPEYLADQREWRPDVKSASDGRLGTIDMSEVPGLKEAVVLHQGHTFLVTLGNGGGCITVSASADFKTLSNLGAFGRDRGWKVRNALLKGLAALVLPN